MDDLQKDYSLKATYSQTQDGSDPSDEGYQFLRMKTDDCGGGTFYILQTKRWAFNNLEELLDLINEFIEKHGRIQQDKKQKKKN